MLRRGSEERQCLGSVFAGKAHGPFFVLVGLTLPRYHGAGEAKEYAAQQQPMNEQHMVI